MAMPLRRSYLDRVEDYQSQYPALRWLVDFRKGPDTYVPRLSVLEFSDSSVREEPIKNPQDLETYWSDQSSSENGCKGRLYVLEDLSAPYIEAFGGHFNINPYFFATHLYVPYFWKSEGTMLQERRPSRLSSTLCVNPGEFSLRYYELRRLTGPAKWDNSQSFTAANVRRRVLSIRPEAECNYAIMIRNSSFWVPPSKPGCWDALMLVDPPVGDQWALGGLNKLQGPTFTCKSETYLQGFAANATFWEDNASAQPSSMLAPSTGDSLFDDAIFFWKYKASTDEIKSAISNPLSSTVCTRRSVAFAWSVHLEFITGVINNLETRLWGFESIQDNRTAEEIKRELSKLGNLMASVNQHRRRIWWYIDHMRCNLEVLGQPPGDKSNNNKGPPKTPAGNEDPVLEDFSSLYDRLQYSKDRIESLMPVVMGAFSLLETQQSALEAKYVSRLTSLATVFVPLSFLTGIFGMSGSYLPGEKHFWIFWVVSLPLVAIAFTVVYATKYMRPNRWLLSW